MKIEKHEVDVKPSFQPYQVVITVEDSLDELELKNLARLLEMVEKRGYYHWITLSRIIQLLIQIFPRKL